MQLTQWANCTTRLHVLCDRFAGDNFLDGSVSTEGQKVAPLSPPNHLSEPYNSSSRSRPDNANLFSLTLIILSVPYSNTFRRIPAALVSIRKSPNRRRRRRSFIVFAFFAVSYPPAGENNIPSGKFIRGPWPPRDGGSHRCEKWLWEFRVTSANEIFDAAFVKGIPRANKAKCRE